VAKLGTSKRPLVVQVRTSERAQEVLAVCDQYDWKAIVGIEPNKPEDLTDFERLLGGQEQRSMPVTRGPSVGRNDPCPCGSGAKFKKCCGRAT